MTPCARRDARLVRPKYIRVFCLNNQLQKDARAVRPYYSIDSPIDDFMCVLTGQLLKISIIKPLKTLAMARFVLRHFVNSVMNSVEVLRLSVARDAELV